MPLTLSSIDIAVCAGVRRLWLRALLQRGVPEKASWYAPGVLQEDAQPVPEPQN